MRTGELPAVCNLRRRLTRGRSARARATPSERDVGARASESCIGGAKMDDARVVVGRARTKALRITGLLTSCCAAQRQERMPFPGMNRRSITLGG